MYDPTSRMAELQAQGFHCSQILLLVGLESQGRQNVELVRAMTGLANGLGDTGKTCGGLTGAVCLLGLFAGRGSLEEQEHPQFTVMVQALVNWFETTYGTRYNGIDCQSILQDDAWNRMLRCPGMVLETYAKVVSLLEENGITME